MAEHEKRDLSYYINPSTVTFKGHPVHPMLVTFPIAFFLGALASDLAYLWTLDIFWARMSRWLLIAGLTGGLAAALAGVTDMLSIHQARRHPTAWSHFLVAITLLSLATGNLLMRLGDHPGLLIWPWGLLLSVDMAIMVALTGWLGGNLVFRNYIGADDPRAQ